MSTVKEARWGDVARPATALQVVVQRRGQGGAGRDHLWLVRGGRRLVDLLPRLLVSYRRPGRDRPRPAMRTHWLSPGALTLTRAEGGGWTARARVQGRRATHTVTLAGATNDPRVRLRWEARYHRDLLVGKELARFILDPVRGGAMTDRAYREVPLGFRQHAGALGPRRLTVTLEGARSVPLTLSGGRGVQGLMVRRRRDRAYNVDLELDHRRNHPFRRYRRCVKKKRKRVGRRRLYLGLVRAGSRRSLTATWTVGPARLVTPGRFARGMGAALVLVDHADQSSAPKLEALAYGRSGALARGLTGGRYPGLVNRGLAYTKTIFIKKSGPYHRQLEDPRYRRLLDHMARRGVEIGVHSPTGRRDRPAKARAMLRRFRAAFTGRTWVDHQPNTNCEAIGNRGWNPRSPWYMLGHLSDLGIDHIWSGTDLPLAWGSLNLLAPARRSRRRAVIYRHTRLAAGGRPPPVVFTTSWMFVSRKRLKRYLSERWLRRLVRERGLFLGHTYLDTHRQEKFFKRRSWLRRLGPGRYALHPEMDRHFQRLARWQARGDLWVAGVEAVAGHLLAAMDVELDHRPRGQVLVTARRALRGFTLLLPAGAASARVDGAAPAGQRRRGGRLEVWFDLRPRRPRLLTVLDAAGRPLELLRPVRISLRYRAAANGESAPTFPDSP